MGTVLSTKGQIVIPHEMREANNWRAGQLFEFIQTEKGLLIKPISSGHDWMMKMGGESADILDGAIEKLRLERSKKQPRKGVFE